MIHTNPECEYCVKKKIHSHNRNGNFVKSKPTISEECIHPKAGTESMGPVSCDINKNEFCPYFITDNK